MRDRPQSIAAAPFRPSPSGAQVVDLRRYREPFTLIPDPPEGMDETDGIRATFALHLRAEDRHALAAVARRFYLARMHDREISGTDPFAVQLVRAVARDLAHAAWILSIAARLDDDPGAAQLAAGIEPAVRELAERIAAEVGR